MENLLLTNYADINFEVCTSERSAITDREILDSIVINDYAEEEEERRRVKRCASRKAKIIRDWTYNRVT